MICLTGLPLAGKTTLATKLAAEFNLTYISTGDIVRGMGKIEKDFADLEHIKKTGYSAKHDGYINRIITGAPHKSIIDGYPRNMGQANLVKQVPIVVLLVEHINVIAVRAKARGRDELDNYWLERIKSFDRFLSKLNKSRAVLITTKQEVAYEWLRVLAEAHGTNTGIPIKL